jgi:integrase
MRLELREGIAGKISVPTGRRDVLVFDTKQAGFYLRKHASGRLMYGVKYTVSGKARRVDVWDVVKGNLATARKEAADVRAKARLGIDVLADRQAAIEAQARTRSVLQAATEYLEARKGNVRPTYYTEMQRHLVGGKRANGKAWKAPTWKPLHSRDIASIKRGDIVTILDDVATKCGAREADKAKVALSSLYAWMIDDKAWCEVNPVVGIRSRSTNDRRERTLTAEELREVWQALEVAKGDFAKIVRLLMLTGCRRDEVGQLAWSEVLENGSAGAEGARIELPGSRTKNHLAHVVPLAPLALQQLPGKHDGWAFVFGRRAAHGYSGYSKSKKELDATIAANRKGKGVTDAMPAWCLHDLRRTFATMMRELRLADTHLVELMLNHISGTRGGVAGVYDRSERLEERKEGLTKWAEWIGANVASRGS